MKCKCQTICRNAESILSFSYQYIITEGANMRPVKACAPRWTFCFICANDKLYHELKWNMLIKRAHWAFYWPKYAYINLADVWTVDLLVHGTCLD